MTSPEFTSTVRAPFWRTVWRSIRLRCPHCGQGRMFGGYFRMHPACPRCGLPFEMGAGYYLGSIYVNYGITALLVIIGYFAMFLGTNLSDRTRLWLLAVFCVLFPMWFFRYARSLWRGMDHYFDPPDNSVPTQTDRKNIPSP